LLQDFEAENKTIIEYDLLDEDEDPIYWSIDSVSWNEDGTASHAHIDC